MLIPFKTVFIVNPKAGNGRAERVWRKMEPLLRDAGQPYRVHYTRWRGDATSIAEKMRSNGAELIIGVGGDGTLLEVVNGLDLKKNILGIIPAGTGNGFRRSLKIPGDYRKVLLGMPGWEVRRIDLGTFNDIRFLNQAGFIREVGKFKGFQTQVRDMEDGRTITADKIFIAMVANGPYYGGQLCIAPQADIADGRLNLLLVQKMNFAETAVVALRAFLKNHLSHRAIYTASCREVTIDAAEYVPVQIDGELLGSLPARIQTHPGALQVLAPPVP